MCKDKTNQISKLDDRPIDRFIEWSMNQSIDKMGRIHISRQKLSVFWLLCLVGSLNASIIFGKKEGGEAGGENENVAHVHYNRESVAWTHNYSYSNSVCRSSR